MSRSRRPSVTIYDYPEDLNPFKDSAAPEAKQQTYDTVELRHNKEPKNKFWTFGRSKKKRSNSFSVKSAWSGLFGKRKEQEPELERRTTITTVSTSYHNGLSPRPVPPPRSFRDQREFDEAFGPFTRRKKYTMDSSSTYGSNLTVNGDPARLYNGSPQENTASILGELTPKPPARRFGQVSPRPKDEIPPLEFEAKEDNQTLSGDNDDRISEEVPVPTRRNSRRPIPRVNVLESPEEEDRELTYAADLRIRDENENLADDYTFRRCSQDAVRRSNLSINSCISTASGISTLGRKKRRAPMPPQKRESTESSPEEKPAAPSSSIELQITEPIDIAKVTEDIEQMTKKSQNIDETINSNPLREEADGKVSENEIETPKIEIVNSSETVEVESGEKSAEKPKENPEVSIVIEPAKDPSEDRVEIQKIETPSEDRIEIEKVQSPSEDRIEIEKVEEPIEIETIEINRIVEDKIEIFTDINANSQSEDQDDVEVRNKSAGLSRSDSFSVKEHIEQIERQLKELESKNPTNNNGNAVMVEEVKYYEPSETRRSIQANRKSFFKNMVSNDPKGVKIEIKELPREQRDIQVVKLTDPPVAIEAPKEPVKIVALHISEPIKQTPEILNDISVNPLPKPRRHSSTPAQSTLNSDNIKGKVSNDHLSNKSRGDSL